VQKFFAEDKQAVISAIEALGTEDDAWRNELIDLYYQHPGHDARWSRVMVINAVASYAEQDSKVAALITAGLSDPERLVRQEARRSL
jgi:hypothetical protein